MALLFTSNFGRKFTERRLHYLFNMIVGDLRVEKPSKSDMEMLKSLANDMELDTSEVDVVLEFYQGLPDKEGEKIEPIPYCKEIADESAKTIDWETLFNSHDLTSESGLNDTISVYRHFAWKIKQNAGSSFWKQVYDRIAPRDAVAFLNSLINATAINKYDVANAISEFPQDWRDKVSVQQYWETFFENYAQRFSKSLIHRFTFRYELETLGIGEEYLPAIHRGVIKALSQTNTSVNPSVYFGFAEVGTVLVSPSDAEDILDFALERFEIHIDDEFGDGRWDAWLEPPANISLAITGLIWSALGSTRMAMRWRAAHCVRRLAEMDSIDEIDALIDWMEKDDVRGFGSHKFPFYNLHARQFLLIALARVSLDKPQLLLKHYQLFSEHALYRIDHVLIQKYSAEISLRIEAEFPETYEPSTVQKLRQVCTSHLPVRQSEHFSEAFDTPWHDKGEVDSELMFYHGMDIRRYWYESLGKVFGVPAEQVEELATQVIIKEWDPKSDGSYLNDPRISFWNKGRNDRETSHSHGNYPDADRYSFYLSYHSMFVVAAQLLANMPVLEDRDYVEDKWNNWINRHSLASEAGYWLADRRDFVPLENHNWLQRLKTDEWRWEVRPDDFLKSLLVERNGQTWLNVNGSWTVGDDERDESFRISSALVSPNTSSALLNSLTLCTDSGRYKLPDFEEAHMEISSPPFELKGWVGRDYAESNLDGFDPHAAQISYPPHYIDNSLVESLGLTYDPEKRHWYFPDGELCMVSHLWRTTPEKRDKESTHYGARFSASLNFICSMCATLGMELIVEIQIKRSIRERDYSRSYDEPDYGYLPPYCKVYILSGDGKLRDRTTNLELRTTPS